MGSLKDELGKVSLQGDILDAYTKSTALIMDALLTKPSDPYENMTPAEKKTHERAMMLSQLDSAFEELGINKKLEELKPHLEVCKRLHGFYAAAPHWVEDMKSLKKLIEFIECIDEP